MIVVFDIGNVMVRRNPRNLFRKAFKDEARMERFLGDALPIDFVADTSSRTSRRQQRSGRRLSPNSRDELPLFDERWVETIGGLIEENVALLKRLEADGRPVYALSNFAPVRFALARQVLDFLNEFDISVISGHVCVVKPDPPIYQILFAPRPQRTSVRRRLARQRTRGGRGGNTSPGIDLGRELRARSALPI